MSGGIDLRRKGIDPFSARCVEHLRKIFFLKECSESVLRMLASTLETRFEPPQEVLSREGEDCDYIILFGHGEATARVGGKEVKTFTDGAVLGPPLALLQKLPWDQTITTTAFSDTMVLLKSDFQKVMNSHQKERSRVIRAAKAYDNKMRAKALSKEFAAKSRSSGLDDAQDADGTDAKSHVKVKTVAQLKNEATTKMAEAQMNVCIGEAVRAEDDQGIDLHQWVHAFLEEEGEALQRGMAVWLDHIEFFSELDAFSLERVLKLMEKRSFKRGEHLLTEGEHADAMHVVYCGNVEILAGGKPISKLGPKSILGERSVCVLGEQVIPCGATVAALSQVVITFSMPRPQLLELFIKDKHVYEYFRTKFDVERIKRGVASFRNIRLLQDADPDFTLLLESKVSQNFLQEGDILFTQGQPSSEAYLLCRGAIDIVKNGETVASLEVDDMKNAIILGEFNVLGLWKAPKATVQARTQCLFQVITREILHEVFDEFPDESHVFRRLVESRIEKEAASVWKQEDQAALEAAAAEEAAKKAEEEARVKAEEEAKEKGQAKMERLKNREVTFNEQQDDEEGEGAKSNASNEGFRSEARESFYISSSDPVLDTEDNGSSVAEEDAPAGFLPTEAQLAGNEEDEEEDFRTTAEMRQATRNNDRITLPRDLSEIKEFKDMDVIVLKQLQAFMRPRVYMPGQVLLRQGNDMSHAFVLERGTCSVEVFGADLEPMEGPCVIGGLTSLFTKKVFTTIKANETCFVGAIPKHLFAAVLDSNPEARRATLLGSDRNFKKLCDDFGENILSIKGLIRQLAAMPFLSGASETFLTELAEVVEPRLLLPGQEVMQKDETSLEPQLIILFEGHFHFLQGGFVVGTMSPKMVAGVLEVFDLSKNKEDVQMKSDEICKVGTIRRKKLFQLLGRFPDMRERFEALVHNELEDGINFTVLKQPMFEGMPSQFLKKVSMLLDRHLELPGSTIVREGQFGDFMIIMNIGKAEIQMRGLAVGMLWPGKAFGGAQMIGSQKEFHATLVTKGTCHTLTLSRRCLGMIIPKGPERPWLTALKTRAEIAYQSEVKYFRQRHLHQRLLNKTGLANTGGLSAIHDSMFMHRLLASWLTYVQEGGGDEDKSSSGSSEEGSEYSYETDSAEEDAKEQVGGDAADGTDGTVDKPKFVRRTAIRRAVVSSAEGALHKQKEAKAEKKDEDAAAGRRYSTTGGRNKRGNTMFNGRSVRTSDGEAESQTATMRKLMERKTKEVEKSRDLCFSRQLRRTTLTCGEEGALYSSSTLGGGTTAMVPVRPRSAPSRPRRPRGVRTSVTKVQPFVHQQAATAAMTHTGVLIQLAQKVHETKTRHNNKECREEAMKLERQLQEIQDKKKQGETSPRRREGKAIRFADPDFEKEERKALPIPRPRYPGRLDGWKTMKPDPWIQTIREEIPRHFGAIQVGPRKLV